MISVKEGINLPRYPSVPGRLRAKRQEIERVVPDWPGSFLRKLRLRVPEEQEKTVEILGTGPEAAPRAVEILHDLGLAP